MDEFIKEFLVECQENLEMLERHLAGLKDSPPRETLVEMFRAIHTIKGSAGFLALPRLEALTHAAESLLGDLRDGTTGVTPEITAALSKTSEAARTILANIESTGKEGDEDNSELISKLKSLSKEQ